MKVLRSCVNGCVWSFVKIIMIFYLNSEFKKKKGIFNSHLVCCLLLGLRAKSGSNCFNLFPSNVRLVQPTALHDPIFGIRLGPNLQTHSIINVSFLCRAKVEEMDHSHYSFFVHYSFSPPWIRLSA